MRGHATAVPAPAQAPAAPSHLAVQRCSCGSGEKEEECQECGREAVQARSLGGASPAAPGGAAGAGFSLGNVAIFPPEPAAARWPGAVQRSSAVDPPPGREEDEEPGRAAAAEPAAVASTVEEGDDGEAVAGIEAGQPFGGGGRERPEAPEGEEALQTSPAAGVASSPAAPGHGRTVDARAVGRRLAGGGSPLSAALRRPMERFFGRDLGGVRVHADDRSGRLARALSAEAFTVGEHVVFGSGAWRPGEAGGRTLLAHELRHVLQQRAGLSGEIVRRGIGRPGDSWEREAEEAARDFSRREARDGGPPETPAEAAAEGAVRGAWEPPLPTGGSPAAPARSTAGGSAAETALQLYSASTAAGYARRWALGVNPAYGEFDSDCTNFVSQCLEAGGWQMVLGCSRCGYRRRPSVWWFERDGCPRWIRDDIHASHTWGGADNLFDFLKASGRGALQGHAMDLGVGDVLQFDNKGNHHMYHTMMVTRKTDANLYLSYHNSWRLDEPFYAEGDNEGILARHASPPYNYYAWKITGDTGPMHRCSFTPEYLGMGARRGTESVRR